MAGAVANCKKCGMIFQKVSNDFCSKCAKQEEEQVMALYRALQNSEAQGGIAIDELSSELGVPVDDIERFYREGRLSTAGIFLKFSCQGCGVMTGEIGRRGRYCLKCSEMAANKAGVEVKTIQALNKAQAQEQMRQQQLALLKKNQPAPEGMRKFGGRQR